MAIENIISIRESKRSNLLPKKMRGLVLLGYYEDKLFFGSEDAAKERCIEDTIIFGYSLKDKKIIDYASLKEGAYVEAFNQKENILYVGTRFGDIASFDMENFKKIADKKQDNAIECIAADKDVFFSVNGTGVFKTDCKMSYFIPGPRNRKVKKPEAISIRLGDKSEKAKKNMREFCEKVDDYHRNTPQVTTAITLLNDEIYNFYFSNGNDPFLDGSPAGGIVEVWNKDMNIKKKNDKIPYATKHVIKDNDKILFATTHKGLGGVDEEVPILYSLNTENLSYSKVCEFTSSVNNLIKSNGNLFAGLENGEVKVINKEGKAVRIFEQEEPIKGLAINNKRNRLYIGSNKGYFTEVSY